MSGLFEVDQSEAERKGFQKGNGLVQGGGGVNRPQLMGELE
jgi:hypothetical protein